MISPVHLRCSPSRTSFRISDLQEQQGQHRVQLILPDPPFCSWQAFKTIERYDNLWRRPRWLFPRRTLVTSTGLPDNSGAPRVQSTLPCSHQKLEVDILKIAQHTPTSRPIAPHQLRPKRFRFLIARSRPLSPLLLEAFTASILCLQVCCGSSSVRSLNRVFVLAYCCDKRVPSCKGLLTRPICDRSLQEWKKGPKTMDWIPYSFRRSR